MNAFSRVCALIGKDSLEKLKNSKVAVFGIGGVGGFAVEALARCGVGTIAIFDNDAVDVTNLNRQIVATVSAVGKDKVDVMKERLLSINPEVKVETNKVFYLPENAHLYDLSGYDYVIDAIDTVSAKIEIIYRAKMANVPVISCMGTGGKLDITKLKVTDIEKTSVCPLARVMRRELKKRKIFGVKAVWSEEQSIKAEQTDTMKKADGKTAPPSMIFVPAVAGLMLAKEVVMHLTKN